MSVQGHGDPRHGLTGIDHVLIGVRDLEAARAAWMRLGFTASPRGRHIGWGTANYCLMFEDDYIELIGIVDPSQFTNNLDGFLAQGEGLLGVAFASPDANAAKAALELDGLEPDEPKDLARLLELPGGTITLAFRLLFLGADKTPGLRSFICEHLSRDQVFRPEWLHHANGARGLGAISIPVADRAIVEPAYKRLFGAANLHLGERLIVDTGTAPLVFEPPRPGVIPGLAITVADLAATARHLRGAGIAFRQGPARLDLAPAEATGVALSFVEG